MYPVKSKNIIQIFYTFCLDALCPFKINLQIKQVFLFFVNEKSFKNYKCAFIINTFSVSINITTNLNCTIMHQFFIHLSYYFFLITPKADRIFAVYLIFIHNTQNFMYLNCNTRNQYDKSTSSMCILTFIFTVTHIIQKHTQLLKKTYLCFLKQC